jgi:hypothetical protein
MGNKYACFLATSNDETSMKDDVKKLSPLEHP